ncbi:MAG: cytochrome c biogenesis protein [Gemmataceae bacterium]|nr:cytochrome c biogenesis protein [Gemmataceae bacterium]
MLEGISRFCFGASYAVALILELIQLIWPRPVQRLTATGFGIAGLLAHTAYLAVQRPPLSSQFGTLLLLAWILAIFYVYGSIHYRKMAWGIFVLPVVLGLVLLTYSFPPDESSHTTIIPALDSLRGERFWSFIHGGLLFLAAVGVCIGFVSSVMYLVQARRLRAKVPPGQGMRLLSLERLEEMNRRAINLAFPLLTGGVLVGIALMFQRGEAWDWTDPRAIGGTILWLVFALLLYLRYGVHLRGRRLAQLTIVAFALLVFALASSHTPVQGGSP